MYINTQGSGKTEHGIEFIETTLFTRQIKQIATDDELMERQRILIACPDKGDVIQKTGGLRKIRMAVGSQGKSGGARVYLFSCHCRDCLSGDGISEKYQR